MKEKSINPDLLRILGILKNRNFIGPEFVYFNLTRRCNLNCLYCRYHSAFIPKNRIEKNIDLPFDKIKELLVDFSKLNIKKIWLSGEGEPFLYPEIDNLITLANEKDIRVNINTNATFDTEKLKLLPFIDSFTINLSAASNKTYEKIHKTKKKGMFYKVLKNIMTINNLRKKHSLNITLQVNYIINKFNFKEINDFLILSKKIGINRTNFRVMNQNDYNKSLILSNNDIEEFRSILKFGFKIRSNSNIEDIYEIFNNISFLRSEQERKKYNDEVYKVNHCYMGWLFTYIDIKGDVFICCSSNKKLGNIYKNNFSDIWNSSRFHKIRLKYKNEIDTNKEYWKSCRLCWFANSNKKISERLEKMKNVKELLP